MVHNEVEEQKMAMKECFLCVSSSSLGHTDNHRENALCRICAA